MTTGGVPTAAVFLVFQLALLLLFAFLAEFPDADEIQQRPAEQTYEGLILYYLGIHVMILVGLGFIVTFLRKYSMSAVSWNYVIAAFMMQWTILVNHFWQRAFKQASFFDRILIGTRDLVMGDFGCLTVLLSYAVLLGKVGPLQLLVMGILEVIFYELNVAIASYELGAVDIGGAVVIHLFSAVFGLAASRMYMTAEEVQQNSYKRVPQRRASMAFRATPDDLRDNRAKLISSTPTTDVFALVGTLFLAVFWPTINAAMAIGTARERHAIATVFGLAASTTTAFAFSLLLRGGKFSMADVQAATLAGGVAVGSTAAQLVDLWAVILIGMISGMMAVVGFTILTPIFEGAGIHDTAGVFWIHGIPGLIGGIATCIAAAGMKGQTVYGQPIEQIFPSRADFQRDSSYQGGMQAASLFITIGIALGSGALTGLVLRFVPNPGDDYYHIFDDTRYWEELAEPHPEDSELEIDAKPDVE